MDKKASVQLHRLQLPDTGPCHLCRSKLCLEVGVRGGFPVLFEQPGPVTIFLLSCYLVASWVLLLPPLSPAFPRRWAPLSISPHWARAASPGASRSTPGLPCPALPLRLGRPPHCPALLVRQVVAAPLSRPFVQAPRSPCHGSAGWGSLPRSPPPQGSLCHAT